MAAAFRQRSPNSIIQTMKNHDTVFRVNICYLLRTLPGDVIRRNNSGCILQLLHLEMTFLKPLYGGCKSRYCRRMKREKNRIIIGNKERD